METATGNLQLNSSILNIFLKFWLEEKRAEEEDFKEAQETGGQVEKTEEHKDGNMTLSTSTTVTKTVKATFKKSGKGLFKSSAGTNSKFNATTSGIAQVSDIS